MAYGILGGLGEGLSKVAEQNNAASMDQYKIAVQQAMEQRIYERGLADKAKERQANMADAKDLAKFKSDLDAKDPKKETESELKRFEVIDKKYAGTSPDEIQRQLEVARAGLDTLLKLDSGGNKQARPIADAKARVSELEYALQSRKAATAPTYTSETATDPLTGEEKAKQKVSAKGVGANPLNGGQVQSGVVDYTSL